jgi:hypothetical protein
MQKARLSPGFKRAARFFRLISWKKKMSERKRMTRMKKKRMMRMTKMTTSGKKMRMRTRRRGRCTMNCCWTAWRWTWKTNSE